MREEYTDYKGDIIATFLSDKLHLRSGKVCLYVFTVIIMINVGFVWFSTTALRGEFKDWHRIIPSFVINCLIMPVYWEYYLWLPIAVNHLFASLKQNNILKFSNQELERINKCYQKSLWGYISGIVSIIILIVIYCAVANTPKSWWNPSKAVFIFQVAMWSFSFYATCMIIIKATLTVINLRRLFIGKKLSLHPFHPDGCSGFGILTKYATKFTRLIVVSGIMLVIWEYWLLRSAEMLSFYAFLIHLGFIVYIIIAPLCFFGSLMPAHNAMKAAKKELLWNIETKLDKYCMELCNALPSNELIAKTKIEYVRNLKDLYDVSKSYPTWPFNTAILRKFISTTATPILAMLPIIVRIILIKKFGI